ncbi:MAG: UPF0280 family protein [Desulfovibrionaceae bacterium]|nr:UPF0280 family protein [Desulfovibrionaceae bacterium]
MSRGHASPARTYRESVRPGRGEVAFQVVVEQTDLFVVAERDLSAELADFLRGLRAGLKTHILLQPEFARSLVPVEVPESAPALAREMARAAAACGVGPMAAVAGAIAQAVVERFAGQSPNLLVENGGDIFMRSTRGRTVALLAEPGSGARLGLRFEAREFPLGLCSSSGTIGHSLSLGQGDLVAVRAKDAAFADAAATALANELGQASDLEAVVAQARSLACMGLDGVFAQCRGRLAVWGRMDLVALA